MCKKKFIARGQFQGETAVITGNVDKSTVMVEHGKVISDNPFPMPKGYLEDM